MATEPPPAGLEVTIQRRVPARGLPSAARLRRVVRAALPDLHGALTLRIVDALESRQLNHTYRGKDKPTNVLSFHYDDAVPETASAETVLGDLVLCAEVVAEEARIQGKAPGDHWAHLVVHGCLHLLGLDHQTEADAEVMEAREVAILATLGIPDPYA